MLDEPSATVQGEDTLPAVGANRIYADGEMAGRIRRFAWVTTPVGAMAGWSDTLLCALNMVLESQFPSLLFWGPEIVVFYNDAYQPLFAEKHPEALGKQAKQCWPEVWSIVGPQC
jgi:hypothetical protein